MTTPEPQPCRPVWEPQWPQNVYWRAAGFALLFTACTPAMFALAVAVSLSRTDSTGALAVSYFGLVAVLAMGSAQFWRLAGLRFLARRPRLGVHVDGAGTVSVVKPRVLIVPAVIALSGCFVCCAALAWAWWMGWPSASIPESDGRKEAAWAASFAALALVGLILAALTKVTVTVRFTAEGLVAEERRAALIWDRRSVLRARWNDIEAILPDTIVERHNFFTSRLPVVDFRVGDGAQVQGPAWAYSRMRNYRLALHKLAVEPNVFLAVLRQLHENPECRRHLADPAFREMFTIPPLHRRWRLLEHTP